MRLLMLVAAILFTADASAAEFASHAPMRPLPTPSTRALPQGPMFLVDAARGDDAAEGSAAKPWRSIAASLPKLRPGDTLVLRGGTYYEHLTLKLAGDPGKPITIRSHPGELAVIDGGIREFFEEPAKAWEPLADGAPGEFRSTNVYAKLGEKVMGHFGDSMVPLHGYRNLVDLRSTNELWNLTYKLSAEGQDTLWCGPGVWYDKDSGRIHCRLGHTSIKPLGDDNYRGVTDPRKLPLIIGGDKTVLAIEGGKHLRFHDLVLRGGARATISLERAEDIEFDGVTAYAGSPALMVRSSSKLRFTGCALRGISAPWSFRTSHKYRGTAAYLVTVTASDPPTRDVEIAHSELTDSHDGLYIGTIRGLKLHHSLVENFNDDGIYLTAAGVGGDLHIHQNRIGRCLHAFAFAGEYKPGAGVWVYRNVFDLRGPNLRTQPRTADDPDITDFGRIAGDHGGPVWEPIWFYHNTVITAEPAFRDFYAAGWGGHMKGTSRRVFNNIFLQVKGNPGLNFDSVESDLQADGNLLWGLTEGKTVDGNYFDRYAKAPIYRAAKGKRPPGWGTHDVFADPKVTVPQEWRTPADLRPPPSSPAIDAGVALPAEWPDPLREQDAGKPDIGALPAGVK